MSTSKVLILCVALGLACSAQAMKSHSAKTQTHLKSRQVAEKMTQQAVNINQADEKTLETVKGIGPKKAKAIVAYRQANGSFSSLGDLTKVRGIGEKKLAKIKEYLTV